MITVQMTEEQIKKLEAKRAEKAALIAERNKQAGDAWVKALESVDFDESKLIRFDMPETLGGSVILRLPTHEAWAMTSKRLTKALISDGKKEDAATSIAGLITQLLEYPALPELQKWRNELPDLYSEIHNALDARCSHGQGAAAGK